MLISFRLEHPALLKAHLKFVLSLELGEAKVVHFVLWCRRQGAKVCHMCIVTNGFCL